MTETDIRPHPAAGVAAGIGHNGSPDGSVKHVSLDKVTIWAPALEQADDVPNDVIDGELTIIFEAGQRIPVPSRLVDDGVIEVVAAVHVVRAIERYNEQNPDCPLELQVRLYNHLDDPAAYRLLAQELDPGYLASSLARGRFFMRAVEAFGSEAAAAKACRVSKATVSKNLDVVRAFNVVGSKVLIARDISQRDAMWLMAKLGREADGADACDQDARARVMATLGSMDIVPAKKLFAELRAATRVRGPRRGERVLTLGDREIARLREKNGRPVRIDLADVGDVELDTIIGLIREALARSRRAIS